MKNSFMASENMSAPQNYPGFWSATGPTSNMNFSPRTGGESGANHFEIPNLSSMLYEFTNKEKDLVERCWRIGNYNSLRDLPTNIAPSNVLKSYQEKQDIAHLPNRPKKLTALSDGGYFSKFEWQPESYDDYIDKEKKEREHSSKIIEKLHGKNKFLAGRSNAPLKHEGQFGPADEHVYPFFIESDPYEATIEEVLKNKWMEEAKKLHGEFVTLSKEPLISKANRNALGDMVAYIKKTILADWQDINFVIGTNPEEMIEIKFDGKTIDTTQGLHAYMNTLLNNNQEILKFDLRRVIHYWGYKEAPYIYYVLAPSWVKLKINDIMNFYKKADKQTRSSFDSFSQSEERFDKRLAERAQEHKPVLYSREIEIV
jgi:hypothetical protein